MSKWIELPRMFPEQRRWRMRTPPWSLIISEEGGRYSASAKPLHNMPWDGQLRIIGYESFATWEEADQACKDWLRKNRVIKP